MPTNLYGPGDNYHPENSHVIPALIRRFHEAKIQNKPEVVIWGSGKPMREFLYVDDMASASVHVMSLDKSVYQSHTKPMLSHLNVGSGVDVSINQLAQLIKKVTGYGGEIKFDISKPDGSQRKLMNSSKLMDMGWSSKIDLKEGIEATYRNFVVCYCSNNKF